MLKDFSFDKVDDRYDNFKRSDLGDQLDQLQRIVQRLDIPVLILVDGWESSGKGFVINDLTRELDPRYVRVEVFEKPTTEEKNHPSVWRFWRKIPSRREMVVYDRSFYYHVFNHDRRTDEKLSQRVDELLSLEKMLIDDETIVIKLFLTITEETQKENIKRLETSKRSKILLSDEDYQQSADYSSHQKWFDKILKATNLTYSPWHIISAEDLKLASKTALGIVIEQITSGIEQITLRRSGKDDLPAHVFNMERLPLSEVDTTLKLSEKAYDKQLETLQKEAAELVYECYVKKIPIVLAFEGVDAAGKGGAIKRLTRHIDPRSYKIYGINAPNEIESLFHYLWRFQVEMPQDNEMVIFDRSWYGRVLVERVEGFTYQTAWERAYDEINQMEATLTNHGTLVMKFFLYIDADEQASRFQKRLDEPEKNYKITSEDWRNREKWEDYIAAMNEMLVRTDTPSAPWYIVPGQDKYYARIQVLKHFIHHIKSHLENHKD